MQYLVRLAQILKHVDRPEDVTWLTCNSDKYFPRRTPLLSEVLLQRHGVESLNRALDALDQANEIQREIENEDESRDDVGNVNRFKRVRKESE